MYSNFSLGLAGAQVTGVLSSILLAQRMDYQRHGLPKLEQLMFIISSEDHSILLPNRGHSLLGYFTL